MSRTKRLTNKDLKLAGTALALIRMGGEWLPVVRAFHRYEADPEIGRLARLEDLKPAQQRKVQAWIQRLEPASAQAKEAKT